MKKCSRPLLAMALMALGAAAHAAPAKPAAAPKPAPAAAVTAASPATTVNSAQRVTVPLSDPARPGTLHVNLIQGSIIVRGSNRKDVLVEVRPRVRAGADADEDDHDDDDDDAEDKSPQSAGLRQIAQPLAFTVEEENNRVEVSSSDPRRASDMVIEVPARIDL